MTRVGLVQSAAFKVKTSMALDPFTERSAEHPPSDRSPLTSTQHAPSPHVCCYGLALFQEVKEDLINVNLSY